MKKVIIIAFLLINLILMWGQEIYSIDNTGAGDYSDFSSAINYINNLEEMPEGGIIFNVASGQVFTEIPDTIRVVATETAPVIFQKSGEDIDPILENSDNTEALIPFFEASWITFDAISLRDSDLSDDLYFTYGYFINASDHITIKNCTVYDFNKTGIYTRGATTNVLIENNIVYHTEDFFTTETSVQGIKVTYNSEAENAAILNNRIWGLKEATSTAYGIDFNQVSGICANNFVSISADNNDKVYGIRSTGRAGRSMEVYHNTIYLNGTATDEGYGLGLMGGGGDLTVRNNIVINERPDSLQYNVFIGVVFQGMYLDNNVYYNGETEGFRGRVQTYLTDDLAEWQGMVDMDSSSVICDVEFTDEINGDLHIAGASLGDMTLSVESVGITNDIDYDERPAEQLYCGADENLDNPLLNVMESEYTIDASGAGDFVSFAEAAELINSSQVAEGGTVFNVPADQSFSENTILLSGYASEENPITFQKAGAGDNPVIENESNVEALVEFNNASYITFDGIDLADPVADDTLRYEKGYYIFASNMITIKNCNITDFDGAGIHVRDASTNTLIENNELYYTDDYFTSQSTVYGIYVQYNDLADNAVIRNNKIYSIKEASSTVYGIRVWKVNAEVYNNFISIASDNNDKLYGLRMDGGAIGLEMDIFFNTVNLSGTATDDSYCFYRTGTDGLMNVQDNIFINNRDGAYEHLIYDYTFVSGDWNANYNAYYTENGRLGDWGETQCTTLEEWQAASGGDANSVYTEVEFISDENLHLTGSSLGNYDLAGIPAEGILTDIDGEMRHEVNPYMGADENIDNPLEPSGQYIITVNPLQHSFGNIYNNTSSDTMSVSIQNAGADFLTVYGITVPEPFMISIDMQSWVNSIDEFQLEPGETEELGVVFLPSEPGDYDENIDIHSNAVDNENVYVNLTGTALQPGIEITPEEMDFMLTATGVITESQMLTIYNTNILPVVINEIIVSSNFAIQIDSLYFDQLNNITLEDSLVYNIVFSPEEPGQIAGEISIYSEVVHGSGAGEAVTLTGEAFNFQLTNLELEFAPNWLADSKWGDFDNDGDLDILTSGYELNSDYGQMHIYENNGNNTFDEVDHDLQGVGSCTTEWIDFDNDGDLDIFIMGQYEFEVYIAKTYRNDDGSFVEIENDFIALKSCNSDIGDFDADGDYDLLLMGDEYVPEGDDIPHLSIYENDGSGNFSHVTDVAGINSGEAKFGDYDNDGDLDVAVSGRVSSFNYTVKIFRNDDNVNFTELDGDFAQLRYSSVEWGDHDNDGDLDLIVSGSFENEVDSEFYLYENQGNDTFIDAGVDILGIRQGDIVSGDLDNDGDLDVIVNGIHNHNSWIGYIYLNQGDFQYTLVDSVESMKYADMVLGDFDNDNDLDLFQTGRYDYLDYRVKLFENEIEFVNTQPEPPIGLVAVVDQNNVIFSWSAGSDAQTPADGLNYNICIGSESGTDDILPALADLETGVREVARIGNAAQNLNYIVHSLPQGTYYACIQTIDTSYRGSVFSDEVSFEITWVDGDDNGLVPLATELLGNYPNPFNPETAIHFSICKESNVSLYIYNLKGQKVKTLISDIMQPNSYSIIWNGTDDLGRKTASGVYLYKLKTDNYQNIKKMTLIK